MTRHWLLDYPREWLRPDLIAGVTAAAVVIPKALAYATIAGLPVQVGLYTAFVPVLVYALLGSSRVLSTTTTATLAILAGAQLAELGQGDPATLVKASATLAALVGGLLLLGRLLRLGFVANFISDPVLTGFKAGIGIVIIVDQVPKLLGVHIVKEGFLRDLVAIAREVPHASLPTVAIGVGTIALLLAMEHWSPKAPAPLLAVGGGIAVVALFGLDAAGVSTVGAVPRGLPPITLPDPALASSLWGGALGIALMSFTETIAAGRAFQGPDEPSPRADQELVATGLANLGGAFFGAMPGGGGTSQTAVTRMAGARSQVAGIVTAVSALLVMLLLAPWLARMPQATLGAVVAVYSVGLVDPAEFRSILRIRRREFAWAVVACLGVIALGTLRGILVAIIVSMIALTREDTAPPVHVMARKRGTNVFRPVSAEHPDDETFAGLLIARIEGRMFFANVERVTESLRALADETSPRVLCLDLSAVPNLEYTALKALVEADRRLGARGVSVWLVGLNPVVWEAVQRSPLGPRLGRERAHFTLELAVARYQGLEAPASS